MDSSDNYLYFQEVWFMVVITIGTRVYKPTNITFRRPHIVLLAGGVPIPLKNMKVSRESG